MAYELHLDPRSSHQRIARHVRWLGVGPVLDVGASSGQLGRLLDGAGLTLDAIEPDCVAAAEAEPFYRSVQCSTVEDADVPAGTYRVIVCADVLEHLLEPEQQLQRLVNAATEGALIIVSVPNVAHIAARLLLLAGKFPRHRRGIFDRTHRHYYTRETALELVTTAGADIENVAVTPIPLAEVWPASWPGIIREALMSMQTLAGRFAPRLFGFQWVITARRR